MVHMLLSQVRDSYILPEDPDLEAERQTQFRASWKVLARIIEATFSVEGTKSQYRDRQCPV